MSLHQKLILSLEALIDSLLGNLFWYVILASAVWLFFHVAFRERFRHRRISRADPTSQQIAREMVYSFRSIVIFGLVVAESISA